ncbi:glycosyltransferase family 2 protein [Mucilaginibacter sp. 22184]|uniref:glycosyltransferase family 2 protein n=1 Tax=Mucilaginibacter sp. 22184 TaxID=3453887 RepID=UPI003F87CB56
MEKDTPLVSVCMPAYNAGKYITDTVSSITSQSYTNWELIIVNDGSTDNTAGILKQLTDPRIKVFHQENKGQCAAANQAFQLSKGTLIKFMDADDLISPHFIAEQVHRLGSCKDAIASASWGRFYDDDLQTFKLSDDMITHDCKPIDWLANSMYNRQSMMQCALWLIPRELLDQSGLWNEELSLINDFEFFIRVLLCARQVLFTPKSILYYRSGVANSLSSLQSRAGAVSAYKSIDQGVSHLLSFEGSPRIKKIGADCFQTYIYMFYPYHKDLIHNAELRVRELGGSNSPFPAGGITRIMAKTFGWKLTKRIKALYTHGR